MTGQISGPVRAGYLTGQWLPGTFDRWQNLTGHIAYRLFDQKNWPVICWVCEVMRSCDVGSYDYHKHCTTATHVRAKPTPWAEAAVEIDWQIAPTRVSDNADRVSLLLRPYWRRIGGRKCLRCRDVTVYITVIYDYEQTRLITRHTLLLII